ncbi:hypothetical protein MLD38_024968 [Melastoma candidum]|uniref:Uncharacterized protein n=1 Tax=Melastoma candidum TaxID=119954 RepID=A0ACB9NWZ4_9MYRT|nr:hypothetical protein MLD38_024968 [Melastoma candidum]
MGAEDFVFVAWGLSKPLKYNVALPPAILSRFDLVYVMIDDPDDNTDYHIAHHIVKIHQRREEATTPPFSTTQLKRFIAYAKTLKPKMSLEARKLLVDSYVVLRKGDTNPGSKVAYRMTVRQLEALIRLSEAIARSHLDYKITPCSCRCEVLKTSIISVDSSEIDLSDFQEEQQGDCDVQDDPPPGVSQPNTNDADGEARSTGWPRKKLAITDEYFQKVTQALIMRLRQHEEAVAQEGSELVGLTQKDLIEWYVGQQNENNSYTSMEEAKDEVNKI